MSKKPIPKEKFEFIWEHLRCNRSYVRCCKLHPLWRQELALLSSPLPCPVNPKNDWQKALAKVLRFEPDYFQSHRWTMAAATVKETVFFAPVVWNEHGARNAAWPADSEHDYPHFFESRCRCLKVAEDTGDQKRAAAARDDLRQFFEDHPQVDFKVDSSAPTETALAAFQQEWARLRRVRQWVEASLQRKQQEPRGDWREQLRIYSAVMKSAKFKNSKPIITDRLLRQLFRQEYQRLIDALPEPPDSEDRKQLANKQLANVHRQTAAAKEATWAEGQRRFEKAKTRLRRKVENAFEACRARVEAVMPA
jgi:hypothetical protein